MAIIKSYTDISQSKTLSKILPLESADMRFCFSHTLDGRITGHYPMIGSEPSLGTVPCWSLAALLGVLPNNKCKCTVLSRGRYDTEIKKYVDEWQVGYNEANGQNQMIITADNPVDACVAMIERLHELKML